MLEDINILKQSISILSKHRSSSRVDRIKAAVQRRTRKLSLVFENIQDAHNVAACLRTADIFGIQDIHVVEKYSKFIPNQEVSKKSHRWLTIHHHKDYLSCVNELKSKEYALLVSAVDEMVCTHF